MISVVVSMTKTTMAVIVLPVILAVCSPVLGRADAPVAVAPNKASVQYLQLLENFAGWAEQHWNESEQSYDAQGAGVTWARGNGDVCIVYAVLLTALPDRSTFSSRKIPREVMLDHVRRTLRTVCLANKNCGDPRAKKPGTWGGADGSRGGHWQAGLETEHWVFAAFLLARDLDDDTKTLVRQVAAAEAELAKKPIPSAKPGNTAADDCVWNAGVLGVMAAIYADDPRATSWDEWAKRWALNTEARDADRKSTRIVDGKPLGDWLSSTNVYPDLTLENHGFWDLPYQVCFAALVEPALAYHLTGKKIPDSFCLNAREEGENILSWMTLADGDLLCPQGLDWAERDVQHSWAFTELGTLLDMPWARVAEARCLKLLTQRQEKFGDGALHANDFGYETDLACCWSYSYLLHRYFGKPDGNDVFNEPHGAKVFPHVSVGLYRSPDLVSSVTWFRSRQAVMVVPNNLQALGDYPSFTAYRYDVKERQVSGLGYLQLQGEKKLRSFRVEGEPVVTQNNDGLTLSFGRTIPDVAMQQVGYCALPTGQVLVFSRWRALKDIKVAELVDHPFYWMAIPGYLPTRTAEQRGDGIWSVDGKLQMQILGGAGGKVEKEGLLGSFRGGPFSAETGEVFADSVCIYQAELPNRPSPLAQGDARRVTVGEWIVERADDGGLALKKSASEHAGP
jgi:hypothetical protein